MYRTIWLYYFITGLLGLTAGMPAMDGWASALLPDPASIACRLVEPDIVLSRGELSLCVAAGFNALRDIAGNGVTVLVHAHRDMPLAAWLHLADVLVILCGCVAVAVGLICVWANGMTRLASMSMTGSYTLVRAMGLALDRLGYRA
jgi:hypothetical protein